MYKDIVLYNRTTYLRGGLMCEVCEYDVCMFRLLVGGGGLFDCWYGSKEYYNED